MSKDYGFTYASTAGSGPEKPFDADQLLELMRSHQRKIKRSRLEEEGKLDLARLNGTPIWPWRDGLVLGDDYFDAVVKDARAKGQVEDGPPLGIGVPIWKLSTVLGMGFIPPECLQS